MNVTAITSNLLPLQHSLKPVDSKVGQALHNERKVEEDPREARAKAFYTREEEPWKKGFYFTTNISGVEETRPMTKEEYLEQMEVFATIELEIQQCHVDKIRTELGVLRPEIASKNFSYTLGDEGQIKILDPEHSLTEHELEYLTNLFNGRKGFKDSVTRHAKMAMALVDHDDKRFGSKFKLDLLNIQNTLDYGKLITLKPEQMHEAFVRQILDNGERREDPMVDIIA